MNPLIIVAVFFSLLVFVAVMAPFFVGKGGKLEDSSTVNSEERLNAIKEAILKRWVLEHHSFKEGALTDREWKQRKVHLTNRYIDASRRLDWMTQRGPV